VYLLMAYEFKFPDVGEGITEGKLVAWKVKEGESVKQDQPLAEVETDKAIVEIPAPKPGKVSKLHAKEGETILVGNVLVTFDDGTGPAAPATAESRQAAPARQEQPPKQEAREPQHEQTAAEKAGSVVGFLEEAKDVSPRPAGPEKAAQARKAVIATLAVKKLAKDLNVHIEEIQGTGPGGRITSEDIRAAAGEPSQPKAFSTEKALPDELRKYDFYGFIEPTPMSSIRKAIAHKMVESSFTAPQVTHMDEADITVLHEIREKEKKNAQEKGVKLTYLPFIIKAAISALKMHPLLNSELNEEKEEIIIKKYYNIGIAVDTPDGLLVAVLKKADTKPILELASEIVQLATLAKDRKLGLSDMKGSSFTITNVGAIGGTHFTPILNHPEAAILGLGKMMDKPLAIDGKVEIRKVLPLSLTFDHRVVDGAEAARFMNDIIRHLEDPDLILVEGS